MNLADRLVIMTVLGASAAGVYAIAYKLPNFMDTINGFFYQSWRESSARVLRSGEDAGVLYNAVYKAYRRFAMGVVLIMVAFTPAVYALLINPSYVEGMRYVPALLLSMYFSNMSGFYGGVFTAHRDTGIMGTTSIVSAVICLALCFVLIPVCGLWGATAATLIATIAVYEYRRVKTRRYAALDENRKEQVATAAALVMVFSFFYVYVITGSWLSVAAMLAVSLAYFALMNRTMWRGLVEMVNERR